MPDAFEAAPPVSLEPPPHVNGHGEPASTEAGPEAPTATKGSDARAVLDDGVIGAARNGSPVNGGSLGGHNGTGAKIRLTNGYHSPPLEAPAFFEENTSAKQRRKLAKVEEEHRKQAERLGAEAKLSTFQILKRLSRFAVPHKASLSIGFVMLVLQGAMDLAKPLPLAFSIDAVVTEESLEGTTLYTLIAAGLVVVAIALLEGLFAYIRVLIVTRAGRTIVRDIRATMFDHVQKLSLQYHSRRRSGDLLLRVSGDVQALEKTFTDNVIEILSSAVFLAGMLAIMLYLDAQIGMVALAGLPVIFFFIKRYSTEIRSYTAAQRQREGALATIFHEALGSTRLSRVFNREQSVKNRFESESAASFELGLKATLREERFTWSVEVLGAILTGVVLVFAVMRAQAGAITVGELSLFFFYARGLYRPIRTAIKNASRVWRSLAQAERIIEVLDIEYGVTDTKTAREAPKFLGDIEFKDVSFSYDPDRVLMDKVNLKIPAGRITAIVGPTGAGKTTLVSMVPRLYDPTDGQVLIDGYDIREFTLESLREQISVVLQESTLLYATVAENIAYGRPDAPIEEIETAAWVAGAHDFIKDLPKGYNTEVGEKGETLSGGQRQLLAIARAVIRDAPIVILDEPLTGLDAVSAAQVREGLEGLMENRTVLFITHNLSLVESADEVVVVADGRIVQQGSPEELRNAEGLYNKLLRAQYEEEPELAGVR